MFKTRLISGIFIVIIAALALYLGGNVTLGLIAIISLIGVMEVLRVLKLNKLVLGGCIYVFTIGYYVLLYFEEVKYILPLLILLLMVLMSCYVFTFPKFNSGQIVFTYFSFFYVSLMLSYVYRTRMLENGLALVALIFLSAWGNDTCAYCVGVLFGKHKMTPKLSPKKSIEGAIGGVIGAAILGAIYGLIIKNYVDFSYNPVVLFTIVCFCGSFISIIGDLAASAIKRDNSIKDYGKLIPGHGGILDRFDSIIFTAPVVFYLMEYLA